MIIQIDTMLRTVGYTLPVWVANGFSSAVTRPLKSTRYVGDLVLRSDKRVMCILSSGLAKHPVTATEESG